MDKINELGGETEAENCIKANVSASPSFSNDSCAFLGDQKDFKCSKEPKPIEGRRLCYCQLLKGM